MERALFKNASKIRTPVRATEGVPCCSIFTPCSRLHFLSQEKDTLCEHGRRMCLTGTRQGSAYEEPYCPRTASNCDTSRPGCERTFQFGVVYSRHKLVGQRVEGLGTFLKHYFSHWNKPVQMIIYWNIKMRSQLV